MSNSDICPRFRYRDSTQVVSVRFADIEIVRIDDIRYHVQVRVVEKMDILFGYFSLAYYGNNTEIRLPGTALKSSRVPIEPRTKKQHSNRSNFHGCIIRRVTPVNKLCR